MNIDCGKSGILSRMVSTVSGNSGIEGGTVCSLSGNSGIPSGTVFAHGGKWNGIYPHWEFWDI
jgi:hypothetical protein